MLNLKKNDWKKFWIFVFFFAVVPSILASLGWEFSSGQYFSRQKEEILSEVQRDLAFVRREGDNEFYIQKQLNWFYGFLSEETIDKKAIQKYLNKFRKNGMGFLSFRFFDENRKHIPLEGESDSYRAIIRKLFSALSQPETEGESRLLSKYKSFFETFLGDVIPGDLVYAKSSLVKVQLNGRPGFFYWNSFYSHLEGGKFKGGMIVFFEEADIPDDLAVKSLIQKLNQEKRADREYGFVNLTGDSKASNLDPAVKPLNRKMARLAAEIRQMRSDFCSEKQFEAGILATLQLDAKRELYCYQKLTKAKGNKFSFLVKILIFVFFFAATKTIFDFSVGGVLPEVFLKRKNELLVASVAALPLMAFFLVGSHQILNHRRIVSQDINSKLSSYIGSVDESYNLAVNGLEKQYRELGNQMSTSGMNSQAYSELCSKLSEKNALNKLFLLNENGKILFSWPEKSSHGDLLKKMVPTIGRKLFATKLGKTQSLKSRMNDMMFDSITDSFSELIGGDEGKSNFLKVFEKVDQIVEFWFANNRYYVFSTFLNSAKGSKKNNLMFIWQETGGFSERYLQNQVRRVQALPRKQQPIRLAMMPRVRSKQPFPKEFTKYPFSTVIFEQVVSTGAQQYSVEEMDGEKWLIVASPLKRVPGYILFAMYPMAQIEEDISGFVRIFFLVLFCGISLALFVGRQLKTPANAVH